MQLSHSFLSNERFYQVLFIQTFLTDTHIVRYNRVECRYNAVQWTMLLLTALQGQKKIKHKWDFELIIETQQLIHLELWELYCMLSSGLDTNQCSTLFVMIWWLWWCDILSGEKPWICIRLRPVKWFSAYLSRDICSSWLKYHLYGSQSSLCLRVPITGVKSQGWPSPGGL